MEREAIGELHYIAPRDNLPSIAERGLLSYNRIEEGAIDSTSIADPEVQNRRAMKTVSNRPLHDYVPLYFNARNLMMYDVLTFDEIPPPVHEDICVLRISEEVLDIEDAVIADGNAAKDLTRFRPSPEGLSQLEREHVYAKLWHVDDLQERMLRKAGVMAELLVPDRVPPRFIEGAYVCCTTAQQAIAPETGEMSVTVNGHVFFNSGERSHD